MCRNNFRILISKLTRGEVKVSPTGGDLEGAFAEVNLKVSLSYCIDSIRHLFFQGLFAKPDQVIGANISNRT
jgi:hypothetical protein